MTILGIAGIWKRDTVGHVIFTALDNYSKNVSEKKQSKRTQIHQTNYNYGPTQNVISTDESKVNAKITEKKG